MKLEGGLLMKERLVALLLVLSLGLVAPAKREEGGEGLFHQDQYRLKAPEGWIFDDESLVESGGELAIYPRGSVERSAKVKIYAHGGTLGEQETLEQHIEQARQSYKVDSPSTKFTDLPDLSTESGLVAKVIAFTTLRKSSFAGQVAFIAVPPRQVVTIELYSKPELLNDSLAAFEYVVASFRLPE